MIMNNLAYAFINTIRELRSKTSLNIAFKVRFYSVCNKRNTKKSHHVSVQIRSSFILCEVIPSIFQFIAGYKFITSSFISNSGIKVPDEINKKFFIAQQLLLKILHFIT